MPLRWILRLLGLMVGVGGALVQASVQVARVSTEHHLSASMSVGVSRSSAGLITEYRYDERMRLVEQTQKTSAAGVGELTQYTYTAFSEVEKVTLADGSFLNYQYDSAQRLTKVTDSLGHERIYTLNANGDVIQEATKDPDGKLAQTMSVVIDNLGRVQKTIGANLNEISEFAYDGNGNELTVKDPNQNRTVNAYDALNRMTKTTDPDLKDVLHLQANNINV